MQKGYMFGWSGALKCNMGCIFCCPGSPKCNELPLGYPGAPKSKRGCVSENSGASKCSKGSILGNPGGQTCGVGYMFEAPRPPKNANGVPF